MLQFPRRVANRRGASQAHAELATIISDLRTLHPNHPATLELLAKADEALALASIALNNWRRSELEQAVTN